LWLLQWLGIVALVAIGALTGVYALAWAAGAGWRRGTDPYAPVGRAAIARVDPYKPTDDLYSEVA
jgi:hypothetical protein